MTVATRNKTRRELLKITAGSFATTALGNYATFAATPNTLVPQKGTSMTTVPLHFQTLCETAEGIAEGTLNSKEVTESLLARIELLEPQLHAYITVLRDHALEQADRADQIRASGIPLGPLHGIPIAVKDLCHMKGFNTTAGHSFRKNEISNSDATVVTRLEKAGAIILGKLATTEGAMVGYHRDFKVPRNPWGNLDRWPGVSSSGSGVATAAGLCYASLGTDTGGSIRFPSAANGIVGLKPTWGRVSRYNVLDLAPTLDHIGPMTRSVRDAARVLGVIAGHDPQDPTSLSNPVPDYESEMAQGVAGLRIGWDEKYATDDVEPHVAKAVTAAVNQLAKLGAEIVTIEVPHMTAEESAAWMTLAACEAAAVHEATYPARAADYGAYFRQFLQTGHDTNSVDLSKAVIARKNATGRMAPVFNDIDLLACPTLATESFQYDPADGYTGVDPESGKYAGIEFAWFGLSGRFITIWDFNGYPTLSLPCGMSPDNIPLSLQLVASPLQEAILCRAGNAFEQATNFHLQHPRLG